MTVAQGATPAPKQFFPWGTGNPTFYLVALGAAALAGIVAIAITRNAAIAIVSGLASFLAAGILGFLFGIPRYATSDSERNIAAQLDPNAIKYKANTNLEQISDWLTKIIVGIGLTQFRSIFTASQAGAEKLGEALSGSVTVQSTVEAYALLLLTASTGFIFFYLWSRVYLPRMFERAERAD